VEEGGWEGRERGFRICVFILVSKIGLVSIDDILRGVRERLQEKREGGGSQKIK